MEGQKIVVVCAACGKRIAEAPIENGDWAAAEKWATLTRREHREFCEGRRD